MPKLLVKVLGRIINPVKLLPWLLQAAGEGSFGARVRAGYYWLAGKKGFIVAGLTAVGAFLVQLRAEDPAACAAIDCDSLETMLHKWGPLIVMYAGGMIVSAVDDAVRMHPPEKIYK